MTHSFSRDRDNIKGVCIAHIKSTAFHKLIINREFDTSYTSDTSRHSTLRPTWWWIQYFAYYHCHTMYGHYVYVGSYSGSNTDALPVNLHRLHQQEISVNPFLECIGCDQRWTVVAFILTSFYWGIEIRTECKHGYSDECLWICEHASRWIVLILDNISNICLLILPAHLCDLDKTLLHLPLAGTPLTPFLIIVGYFITVKQIGPALMKNRHAMNPRLMIMCYNIGQVIANAALFYLVRVIYFRFSNRTSAQ